MRNAIYSFVVTLILTFLSVVSAISDELAVRVQIQEIAKQLIDQKLPTQDKFVLKALSPKQSGLPEEFLRMLTTELAASLLKESNFELQLINKFTTEELWEEAIEFGDADFDELYAASQADVMVMLSPRLRKKGLSLSVDAYRLGGRTAGKLLASSGIITLNIKVEEELGINIATLDDSIASVDDKLQRLENLLMSERDLSGNQLAKVFYEFARTNSPIDFTDLFKGCDKPEKLSNDPTVNSLGETIIPYEAYGKDIFSIFLMRCELYNGDELIVPRSMEVERKLKLHLILKTRTMLNSVEISSPISFAEQEMDLPDEIIAFVENAWCSDLNGIGMGETIFKIKIPEISEIYVLKEWSRGASSSDVRFKLAYTIKDLDLSYWDSAPQFIECERYADGGFAEQAVRNGQVLEVVVNLHTQNTEPGIQVIDLRKIEKLFRSLDLRDRRNLQESLKTLGFYSSSIDGRWGTGTKTAFQKLFDYLDGYYPDRQYMSDFGFDDGEINRNEFVNFWKGMYGCNQGMLLSITTACGK